MNNINSLREFSQKKVTDMLDQERVKREQEAKLKADFVRLFNREDIFAVVNEFSQSLDVLFNHYSRASAKDPLLSFILLLPGLNKLTQDFKIVPAILSLQEVIQLFRMFTKDKVAENGQPIGLDSREFKESLVRIAAVGQKEIAQLTATDPPPSVTVQSCTAETVRYLFRFMSLPTDPKRMLDLLKKMNLEPQLHPREKRKLLSKTPT